MCLGAGGDSLDPRKQGVGALGWGYPAMAPHPQGQEWPWAGVSHRPDLLACRWPPCLSALGTWVTSSFVAGGQGVLV